jgi:hypothetical protein
MGRVINTDSTGKRRNQLMRTAAEILRRLSQKSEVDGDVKDMMAELVFCFREIDKGIDQSTEAWEKRDYWIKAEEFRQRWAWVGLLENELMDAIYQDKWEQLPQLMMKIMPHVSDIKVSKFTRKESDWHGSYARLMREKPPLS